MAQPTAEFVLTLEPPEKVIFTGAKLGEEAVNCNLKITNPTKERYAFKVKCTSNEMFRIRPPVGALKPGENVSVLLAFNPGKPIPENGKHYFAIYYIKSADEKKAPRAAWGEHKGDPEGTKRLYVDFVKEGGDAGGEKKEEKKEEEKKEDKKDEEKKDEKKDEKKEKDEEKKEEAKK